MALKATIFKAQVQLSDLQRHVYDSLNLTIARHPSETDERMMIRLLAFLLNSHEQLQMTKGLSTDEEPDIWQLNLAGEIELWIELGLPDERRIRKAFSRSPAVQIFSYGGGSAENWWQKIEPKLARFNRLSVYRLIPEQVSEMAGLVTRNMELQCTIDEGEIWLTDGELSVTVIPQKLL